MRQTFCAVQRRLTPTNRAAPAANLTPFFIGFTVAVLTSLFAPITQAEWNPARDFGPRLVAYVPSWDAIAIPGPGGGFWAYIVEPLIGGPLGGLAWQVLAGDGRPGVSTAPVEQTRVAPIPSSAPASYDTYS